MNTNNESSIDLEKNCAALKISKEIYLRILAKAIDQTRKDIQELEVALPSSDFDKIQAISHRLKGDYDNMRITSLSSIASEMNALARANEENRKGEIRKIDLLLDKFKYIFTQFQGTIKG